jgi:hypothetical protein
LLGSVIPNALAKMPVLCGYVHEVVISCGAEVIARHPRSYKREHFVFDPLRYLALIEQEINAIATGPSRYRRRTADLPGSERNVRMCSEEVEAARNLDTKAIVKE